MQDKNLRFEKRKLGKQLPRKVEMPPKLRQKRVIPVLSMNETTSIKKGLSISIPKDGEEEDDVKSWDWWEVTKKRILPKSITIFIRERFCLEFHGIIDGPVAPSPTSSEVEEVHPKEVKSESVVMPGEINTLD